MSEKKKRKRPFLLGFRVDESEKGRIDEEFKRTIFTNHGGMNAYLRSKVLTNSIEIPVESDEEVNKLKQQIILLRNDLKKIGVNINQIAKQLNQDDLRNGIPTYVKAFFPLATQLDEKLIESEDLIYSIQELW